MATESPRSNDRQPRSEKSTVAALASGLRGSQPAQIVITMLITYSISLAALMWNQRREAPQLVPVTIDAPVRDAARSVVASLQPQLPATPVQVSPPRIATAPLGVQISQPAAIMDAAPEPARPLNVSTDPQSSAPLTEVQLKTAARVCDREFTTNTPLCRKFRGEN